MCCMLCSLITRTASSALKAAKAEQQKKLVLLALWNKRGNDMQPLCVISELHASLLVEGRKPPKSHVAELASQA